MLIKLLNAATATNGVPSGATAGFALRGPKAQYDLQLGEAQDAIIVAYSTAGSAVMTVTLKLWGYVAELDKWFPFGSATTDANRGLLNAATAIGELASPGDTLVFSDKAPSGFYIFDRLYLEITAIGGTATAITAYIIARSGHSS
jgi:hypothetical protein